MQLDVLEQTFKKNFAERGELGASVSVWKDGEEILNLAQGWCEREQVKPWVAETMVPFYSATKALASATLLMLLDENGLTPEDLVCRVWPNFPNSSATFAELMSHQCGLAALDQKASVFEYDAVIAAIEAQEPNWELGDGHGYHPRTFGFLLEEPVRVLSGRPLGEVFHERIAELLELDLWIGLPESEFDRVATLYPGKMEKSDLESGFYKEFNQQGTLVRQAFSSPSGLQGVHEMNKPKAWQSGLPAMGGVGTASSLAKFYQAAIGAIPFFSEDVLGWMKTPVVTGDDRILMTPTRFSCGFQLDPLDADGAKVRQNYGKGMQAFGHPGAGGSHAFGDPETGVSFAYIMNQMDLSVLPGAKSSSLIEALR
ncbi:serine hydrolase domain-containing protein [Rubritalea spongiae]|uniref:Serine hydrolase domain-containing protein n=2 Tax=Rubritalea spongiae TaxID=430797 RepID=A0ABW5E5R3_9BACT